MPKPSRVPEICVLMLALVSCSAFAQQSRQSQAAQPAAATEAPVMMFVQNAQSGTLTEVAEDKGTYKLLLEGVAEETIAFSDRPNRIVIAVSTEKFLASPVFRSVDTPNAALEIFGANESEDVMVLQMQDPVYDKDKATLTYLVRPLETPSHARAVFNKRHDRSLPTSFGPAALFIDNLQASCRDGRFDCEATSFGHPICGYLDNVSCCWQWSSFNCEPCRSWDTLVNQCKSQWGGKCPNPNARGGANGCGVWNAPAPAPRH